MKKLNIFILIIMVVLLCFGCTNTQEDSITSIVIGTDSFQSEYDIDENYDIDNVFIKINYKNGSTKTVPCTENMIVGFDTKTTGEKQLYVLYNNIKSQVWDYLVINNASQTTPIVTESRLTMDSQNGSNNTAKYSFSIKLIDLSNISAIMFSIINEQGWGNNFYGESIPDGWVCDISKKSGDNKTLFVIVYNVTGQKINSTQKFIDIFTVEQTVSKVSVAQIQLSDGISDYNLPNIK